MKNYVLYQLLIDIIHTHDVRTSYSSPVQVWPYMRRELRRYIAFSAEAVRLGLNLSNGVIRAAMRKREVY